MTSINLSSSKEIGTIVADNFFEIEKKVWIFDFVIECLSKVCYHIFQSSEEVMDYNISDVKAFFTRKGGCYHITHTNVFELMWRRSTKKTFFFAKQLTHFIVIETFSTYSMKPQVTCKILNITPQHFCTFLNHSFRYANNGTRLSLLCGP